jgi:hypothetical protein
MIQWGSLTAPGYLRHGIFVSFGLYLRHCSIGQPVGRRPLGQPDMILPQGIIPFTEFQLNRNRENGGERSN